MLVNSCNFLFILAFTFTNFVFSFEQRAKCIFFSYKMVSLRPKKCRKMFEWDTRLPFFQSHLNSTTTAHNFLKLYTSNQIQLWVLLRCAVTFRCDFVSSTSYSIMSYFKCWLYEKQQFGTKNIWNKKIRTDSFGLYCLLFCPF